MAWEVASKGDDHRPPSAIIGGLSAEQNHLPCRFFYDERGSRLFEGYPGLEVYAVAADYGLGLSHVSREISDPGLIAWLGSSVGNFDRSDAAGLRVAERWTDPDGFFSVNLLARTE